MSRMHPGLQPQACGLSLTHDVIGIATERERPHLMPAADGRSPAEVRSVVAATLQSVRPDVEGIGDDTLLLGTGAVLDSVGFVSLLVGLEQNLGNGMDLASSFLEQGDAETAEN